MSGSPVPVASASVLIPTYQGMEFLPRVLESLARQQWDRPWDLWVVDSGSRDGTFELLEQRAADFPVPLHTARIHPAEFDHGDTRNRLAAESGGELLVFLTQDAIPSGSDWLARLAADFEDPEVGAAYCRNVPRPDARPSTALLSRLDPGYATERRVVRLPAAAEYAAMDAHERRVLFNFNDVASAVRRELWRRHPFPRTWFGEDVLQARAILEAGYAVVYDAQATVEHSHDYTAEETRERTRVDGRFNAEWLDRICIASSSDADSLVKRFAAQDAEQVEAAGLGGEVRAELAALRQATFHGLYEGGRTALRRPATRMSSGEPLHVLYTVHGFPPETWAGTEVYTLELAREVQALGHRVTILARTAEGERDLELREEEFDGLRVLRLTNHLDFDGMRESYHHPEVERLFAELLERERPDVVHFQQLLHLSAGLVGVARERGIPTVATLNDYWPLCARVQLIRPDGVRCPNNMGLGCLVCVKEKDYGRIESARSLFPVLQPLVLHGGDLLERLMRPPSVKVTRFFQESRVLLKRRLRGWREVRDRQPYVLGQLAQTDLNIAPSRFLRDRYLESGAFDPHRFVYSDYGMRTDPLRDVGEKTPSEGVVRFGFVGSLIWYNGIDVLVEAVELLDDERAVLEVHGDFRPETDEFQARLRDRAGPRVRFRGRFDNNRLAEIYRDLDVLVVPSVWFENSPITIHEAFLLRTPVVTSDIGGMAELVEDGVSGLHFTAGDAHSLAKALRRFLDEPELARSMGQRTPPVKTIEENAREFEYRYRALTCTAGRPEAQS